MNAGEPTELTEWEARERAGHLARDGNRFVRWAAQTRLDTPDFVFTWAE